MIQDARFSFSAAGLVRPLLNLLLGRDASLLRSPALISFTLCLFGSDASFFFRSAAGLVRSVTSFLLGPETLGVLVRLLEAGLTFSIPDALRSATRTLAPPSNCAHYDNRDRKRKCQSESTDEQKHLHDWAEIRSVLQLYWSCITPCDR
jgi:hypothetical protein